MKWAFANSQCINRKMYFALRLLKQRHKRAEKNFVRYRIVIPEGPPEVLEMDFKRVWVVRERRHAYILTVIDTFTRVVLYGGPGFTMKSAQVQRAWENSN